MLRSNQSIVIHAARDLRLEQREITGPGKGEVLVNVQQVAFVVQTYIITKMADLARSNCVSRWY